MTRLDRLNLGHKIVGESVVPPCRQKYHLEYSTVRGFSKRSYKIHPFFIKLVHIVSRNLLYMYCMLASDTRPQFSTANDRLAMHAINISQMFSLHSMPMLNCGTNISYAKITCYNLCTRHSLPLPRKISNMLERNQKYSFYFDRCFNTT